MIPRPGGLLPAGGNLIPRGGGLVMSGRFRFAFYDRDVARQIGQLKKAGLKRAGFRVMGLARKSIKKQGAAKPRLAVQKANPDLTLRELAKLPGPSSAAAGTQRDTRGRFLPGSGKRALVAGEISERDRRKVLERIREIRARNPSPPGTPPHTHTGLLRRNIFFDYDPTSESVVVGSFVPRAKWLPVLHEFAGSQAMQSWVYVPRFRGPYRPIVARHRVGQGPRRRDRWQPTAKKTRVQYPPRPYMAAAMLRGIATGKIAAEFRGRFRVGGG